jgi:hypothetical protein
VWSEVGRKSKRWERGVRVRSRSEECMVSVEYYRVRSVK